MVILVTAEASCELHIYVLFAESRYAKEYVEFVCYVTIKNVRFGRIYIVERVIQFRLHIGSYSCRVDCV